LGGVDLTVSSLLNTYKLQCSWVVRSLNQLASQVTFKRFKKWAVNPY